MNIKFKIKGANYFKMFPIDSFFENKQSVERFKIFLKKILSDDIRRVWIWAGTGNNGKTTLIKMLQDLGLVDETLSNETFIIRQCKIILAQIDNSDDQSIQYYKQLVGANELLIFDKTFESL